MICLEAAVRYRKMALSALAIPAVLLLGGCVFSPGASHAPSVAPDEVAALAEDSLEEETGQRPRIDCGEDRIQLEVGAEISCLLIDPVAGLEFDTIITVTAVTDS